MLLIWSHIFHTLRISFRVAINAKDLDKEAQDEDKEEHTEMGYMRLAQPAVNGSECKSISHAGLTFGNSGQQVKRQNVLAVRRYPLIAMPRLYKQMLEEN